VNALVRRVACAALLIALGGCATVPGRDPFEGFNRAVFAFNEKLDEVALKPVATGYQAVVPQYIRTGVDNVFANIGDLWSAVNHLLQAKPRDAVEMGFRFVFNSTFGLAGWLDIAGEAGLERRNEDFGQTLGRWGLRPGPYLVLPVLGPSNLRDTAALPLDLRALPPAYFYERRDRNPVSALYLISTRARLLSATRALDEVALDKYALVRDAYMARRRDQVYDGDPPEEPDADEPAEPSK
jgi:phospholipid-binding lipoprotein MlaA